MVGEALLAVGVGAAIEEFAVPDEAAVGRQRTVGCQNLVEVEVKTAQRQRPLADIAHRRPASAEGSRYDAADHADPIDPVDRAQIDGDLAPDILGAAHRAAVAEAAEEVAIGQLDGVAQRYVVVCVLADLDMDSARALEQVEDQVVAEGLDFDFSQPCAFHRQQILDPDVADRRVVGLVELEDDAVVQIFFETVLGTEDQHVVEGGVALVDLGLAGGEQQIEELEGGGIGGKVQDHAGGEDAAAEIEVEKPIRRRVGGIGPPARGEVAVCDPARTATIGASLVDAAAEGREVGCGVDAAADSHRL